MKKIMYGLMLFLLLPLALAQEQEQQPNPYEQASNYNDAQWLSSSDPTQWDLSLVDWNNQNVWENTHLNSLWSRQDFDLSKVSDSNAFLGNYCDHIGNGGCSFTISDHQEKAAIRFDGQGIKTVQSYASLQDYPQGTLYVIKNGVITIIPPAKESITGTSEADKTWAAGELPELQEGTKARFSFTTPVAVGPQSIPVQGDLMYNKNDDGTWVLEVGHQAVINEIEVNNLASAKKDISLYGLGNDDKSLELLKFEERGDAKTIQSSLSGKPSLFFGKELFAASNNLPERNKAPAREPSYTLDFNKGNPYVSIKKSGDGYLGSIGYGQQYDDFLEVSPLKGTFMLQGEKAIVAGNVYMKNGQRELGFEERNVFSKAVVYQREADSVPMSIEVRTNDFKIPAYATQTNKKGEPLGNTIIISDEHKIGFDGTSHFSVSVDPHKVLGLEKGSFEVIDRLKETKVKAPFLIVATPPHSQEGDETVYIQKATELYHLNQPKERYPIVISLHYAGPENGDEKLAHSNLLDNMADPKKELSRYDFRIIGHSTFNLDSVRGEPYGSATVGLTTDKNGEIIDKTVNFPKEKLPNLVGCSAAEAWVDDQRAAYIRNTANLHLQITEDQVPPNVLTECGTNYDCITTRMNVDVYRDENGNYHPNKLVAQETISYVKEVSESPSFPPFYKLEFKEDSGGNPVGIQEAGLRVEATPLFSAVDVVKDKFAKENEKRIAQNEKPIPIPPLSELVKLVETQGIRFPDCATAQESAALVKTAYNYHPGYKC